MSEHWLRIVPTTPDWTPAPARAQEAARVVRAMCPAAGAVLAGCFDDVTFFDAGENSATVACPACGDLLDLAWWVDRMDEAAANRFTALAVVTPCCAAGTGLDALRYDWPCAFARFDVGVRDPDRDPLTDGELARVAEALGTQVRQVVSHS